MSHYIRCMGCGDDSLDVDTMSCECGYPDKQREAELAALRAERDALRVQLFETGAMPAAVAAICRERDTLRDKNDALMAQAASALGDAAALRTELAALRAHRDQLTDDLGSLEDRMEIERRESAALRARVAELEERLDAMIPLFEEARDALPAITLESAKLRGIRLDLADRMDDVGDPERWAARKSASAASADIDAARAAEAKK